MFVTVFDAAYVCTIAKVFIICVNLMSSSAEFGMVVSLLGSNFTKLISLQVNLTYFKDIICMIYRH